MGSWNNLKGKMEKALELFNLVEALSHLEALMITSGSSPSDLANLLRNHTLRDLHTLHYLAGFQYREEDLPLLERLIRILTDFGYDINKTSPLPFHVTALLKSVTKQNVVLVECLLRCGANVDSGTRLFSPYLWAVKKGNLKCLQVLLECGQSALVTSTQVDTKDLGLLHEAVDGGHLDIVRYLLSKEELGVDVNKEAFYLLASGYFRLCTPLRIALDKESSPIIRMLMKHPGIKRFEELHYLLTNGLTRQALLLLEYFSDEELSTYENEEKGALHNLHPSAFFDKDVVNYTKKLILEYSRRGWDPNSVSPSPKPIIFEKESGLVRGCSLLHLACLYKGLEIIKLLVEDLLVQTDGKLKGDEQLELTPLMILLKTGQFDGAKYLIENGADLNVRGNLGNRGSSELPIRCMRRNLITGNLELNSRLSGLELLVRMGDMDGLPLLDYVLARPDVVWQGANEFHLALEGRNPVYVAKVVKRCSEMISNEDLNWVKIYNHSWKQPEKVPSLVWLFDELFGKPKWKDVEALSALVTIMAQLGYNLNFVKDPNQSFHFTRSPLIFYILRNDMDHRSSDRLLRTILQFDHLQLNVNDEHGRNPVEYLLFVWNRSCRDPRRESMCRKTRHLQNPPILATVKLLLEHGLDVSEMFIGPNFVYHTGFNGILKMMCRAGAEISKEFFTFPNICSRVPTERDASATREIAELKEWKENFDRDTGLSLKHISGLRVRKMLKCVGDLKMLDALPRGLKEAVLDTGGGPIDVTPYELSEGEWSDDWE